MSNKPRLAVFVPSMAGGGAEKSMLRLASGFAQRNYDVDLVLASAVGPYMREVPKNVRIVDLGAKRVLRSMPALIRYLRQSRPHAMLSTLDYANLIALWSRRLARSGAKLAVNEQNMISITSKKAADKRQRLFPLLMRNCYPWADHIIGNSQGVADDLRKIIGKPQTPVRVLYNPVITEELTKKAGIAPDHYWFAPGQPPVILGVGRLTAQKDFPTLIQAFLQVRQSQPARLLILGEGPDRDALKALIKMWNLEDDASIYGFVDNPYSFMSHAALFVLSSRWEGLPTVLIEALYCGSTIVSTDCPSGAREILADGKYGALVPVQDVATLAATMKQALAGHTPRPTAESWRPFELDTIVDQYSHLLFG